MISLLSFPDTLSDLFAIFAIYTIYLLPYDRLSLLS